MSSTAIDQLVQITTTSSLSRASQTADADGNHFRAHLDRATDVGDGKPAAENRNLEPVHDGEAESAEAKSYEEETTSNQQEESSANSESSPAQADSTKEAPIAVQPADEVTLSVIVDTQVRHVEPGIDQTLSTEVVVDTSQHDGQEQQGGQTSPQLAQAPTNPGKLSADAQLNATLPTSEEDATEGDNTKPHSDTEGETHANRPAQRTEDSIADTTTLPRNSQDKAQSADGQQLSHQQPITSPELTDTDDNSAHEQSPQTTKRDSSTPRATARTDLNAEAEFDLTLQSRHVNSTSTENTPPATPSLASNDNVANAARSLGSVVATTASESTGSNVESPTTETANIDQTRFVQRISGAIRSAQLRDGQIQLRLSPPELGTLRIQLTVTEGAVTAHLETDNAAARNVLLDNLPALRERLAEQEIRIEKFDVDVSRDGQQPADHSETTEQQANNDRTQSSEAANQRNTNTVETMSEATLRPPSDTNGLDVRI